MPKHAPVRNVALRAALGAALGAAFHMAPGLEIQNRVRAASGQSPKSIPPSTRSRNLHRPADADIVEPMTTLTAMNVAILAPMRQHQLGLRFFNSHEPLLSSEALVIDRPNSRLMAMATTQQPS